MVRKGLTLIGVLLVAFHVWLFGSQLWNGQLADLALGVRWLIAAGLVAALANLRRRGLSAVWGRHAVALWVLAALLHGPAIARDVEIASPALPEVVATLSQTVISLTALTGVLLIGLAGLRRRAAQPLRLLALAAAPVWPGALPPGSFLHFAPRPPPLA
jgi:hypothetical protein